MRIPPDTYKRMADQRKRLQKMKQGQFVSWATAFWKEAYNAGFDEAKEQYTQSGINASEDIDARVLDIDAMHGVLLSVKGIGEKRAQQVIERILEMGADERSE